MSDIDQRVERLRQRAHYHAREYSEHDVLALCDELERLRREAAGQRNRADALTHHCTGLEAELERLRDDLSSVRRNLSQLCNAVKRAEGLENWPTIAGDFISYVTGRIDHQAAEVERLRAAADKIRLFAQSALYWYASAGSQRVASTPRINHSGATWILRMIRDSEEKPPEGIDKTENR